MITIYDSLVISLAECCSQYVNVVEICCLSESLNKLNSVSIKLPYSFAERGDSIHNRNINIPMCASFTCDLPTLTSLSFHGRGQVTETAVFPFMVLLSGMTYHAICGQQNIRS